MLKWGNESYSKLRDNIWKKEYLLQRHKCGSMHGVSKAHPSLGMELQKKGRKEARAVERTENNSKDTLGKASKVMVMNLYFISKILVKWKVSSLESI